jgi:hypothetical protein
MGYGMLHDDNEVKIDDIVATYDDEWWIKIWNWWKNNLIWHIF